MKKSRFSEEQIVKSPRDADASSVPEAARKNQISEQMDYRWRLVIDKAD